MLHNNKEDNPPGEDHMNTPPPPLPKTIPSPDQERLYRLVQCVEDGGTKRY